jgi:hypothetical protein
LKRYKDIIKGSNNMSNLEPIICKKFIKIFINAKFRTFKLCNCCHHNIEPFMIRKTYNPNDKNITINKLLSYQDDKQKCEIIYNRDKNAVQNMLNILFTIEKKPNIFTRIHT